MGAKQQASEAGWGVGCLGGLWGLGAWAGELVGVGRALGGWGVLRFSRMFKVRGVGVWSLVWCVGLKV